MSLRRSVATACGLAFLFGCGVAQASPLLTNGGFEDGVYSDGVNTSVPNGWTSSAGYDLNTSYNKVVTAPVFTGNSALQFSNFENQTPASLSQTFGDVIGQTYTVDLFVRNNGGDAPNPLTGASGSFMSASAGGTTKTYGLANWATFFDVWVEEAFTFTGTGTDTIVLSANNTPAFWFVDDVSINASASATPLPPTWSIMLGGLVMLGVFVTRGMRNNGAAFATA